MASERNVMSIKKIRQSETILFWIERAAIFLFVFSGGNTRFLEYSLGLFAFTNVFYASLAYDRLFVTPQPKEPSNSCLFFVERYGIWLEALYFFMELPPCRYAAAAVFVLSNIKAMNLSRILNTNSTEDERKEEKQKTLTVEESPEEKDKLINEIEGMPETERTLPSEDEIVSNTEEKDAEDDEDDDGDFDDDHEDEPEVSGKKLPETESIHPEVSKEGWPETESIQPEVSKEDLPETEGIQPEVSKEELPETENIEPEVHHEMERSALIENNNVQNEIVRNKGEDDDEEDGEEDDYSDDDDKEEDSDDYSYFNDSGDSDIDADSEDDDEEEEKHEDDDGEKGMMQNESSKKETKTEEIQENEKEEDSDDYTYYNDSGDSDDIDADSDEEEEEEEKEEHDDVDAEKGMMEYESSEKETKTEEIQENVQAEEKSLKDEEVKETENEKKAREECKDERNDAIVWEMIEDIEDELRSHMLSEEEDRHAELSKANAALIKEKELLLEDFQAESRKWEEERKSLTTKLYDANESLKIYQQNVKKFEEERRDWEKQRASLSSKIDAVVTSPYLRNLEKKCYVFEEENKLLLLKLRAKSPSIEQEQFNQIVHEYETKCQRLEKQKAELNARLTTAKAEVDFFRRCLHNLGLSDNQQCLADFVDLSLHQ